MAGKKKDDFQTQIEEILTIPGVTKMRLAEWAEVDPSTVTRWTQGTTPRDPNGVLGKLAPRVEQAREVAQASTKTSVPSWKSLTGEMEQASLEYVKRTGLLATVYYVVMTWIPSSLQNNRYDVVIHRYFKEVWADMSRRTYNIGDISQTLSIGGKEEPDYDQAQSFSPILSLALKVHEQEPRSGAPEGMAMIHVQLQLDGFPFRDHEIGFIDDFGYRFRGTRAIVSRRSAGRQTNEYLGAPSVLPSKRLKLLVCIPSSAFRGAPSALSTSNRAMHRLLLELDNIRMEEFEAMLWPFGQRYDMSASPDTHLKRIPRVSSTLDELPPGLQEALNKPADLNEEQGESVREVLCREDSRCFLLDIRDPHPSLTYTIIWRLKEPGANGQI